MNDEEKLKAKKYLEENPITFWEKLSINRWTFLDFIAGSMKKGKPGFEGENVNKNFWKYKVKCYEKLLSYLINGKKDFSAKYLDTICGRRQVIHAIKRGFLTISDCDSLKRYK